MIPGEKLPLYSNLEPEQFTYELAAPNIPVSGAEQLATFRVDGDSDFYWHKSTYFIRDAASGPITEDDFIVPLVTVRITDPLSASDLMSGAVPLDAIFGARDLPFILPEPKRLPASSLVRVYLVGFQDAGVGAYEGLRLEFHGVKRFLAQVQNAA